MKRGGGFSTEFGGLLIQAEVLQDGWYYRITDINAKKIVADWTPGPAPSASKYQEPEDIKYEALTTAMSLLGRKDDPHDTFRRLVWHSYGPQE